MRAKSIKDSEDIALWGFEGKGNQIQGRDEELSRKAKIILVEKSENKGLLAPITRIIRCRWPFSMNCNGRLDNYLRKGKVELELARCYGDCVLGKLGREHRYSLGVGDGGLKKKHMFVPDLYNNTINLQLICRDLKQHKTLGDSDTAKGFILEGIQ